MPLKVENNKRLFLKPEEVSPKEMKELKALSGECVPFEDVLKKHGLIALEKSLKYFLENEPDVYSVEDIFKFY